jgi:hypothetical protein
MSLLKCIVFLARCRNAYYAGLHNVWVKFVLGLIKHGMLFVLTVYFAVEGADPYAPMHLVLADMIWVYSVMFYYLDKFGRFVWPAAKVWIERCKYAVWFDCWLTL